LTWVQEQFARRMAHLSRGYSMDCDGGIEPRQRLHGARPQCIMDDQYEDSNGNQLPSAPYCPAATSTMTDVGGQIGICDAGGKSSGYSDSATNTLIQLWKPLIAHGSSCISMLAEHVMILLLLAWAAQNFTKITLPNNTSYHFTYYPTASGELEALRSDRSGPLHIHIHRTWASVATTYKARVPPTVHPSITTQPFLKKLSLHGTSTTWTLLGHSQSGRAGELHDTRSSSKLR